MGCGVGHRRGLDPAWLWLWHRLAASALIGLLAWEPPHAMEEAPPQKKSLQITNPEEGVEKTEPSFIVVGM